MFTLSRIVLSVVLFSMVCFGFVCESNASCPAVVGADPVGGERFQYDRVCAWSSNTYSVEVWGQETTGITICGDGDTDLDLYVYDSCGRLIVSAESYSDLETVYVRAAYRDTLTIKVVNRGGVYNEFSIRAW